MKKEYDLAKLKSRRNPYARILKKHKTVTINGRIKPLPPAPSY